MQQNLVASFGRAEAPQSHTKKVSFQGEPEQEEENKLKALNDMLKQGKNAFPLF